jgi:ADP-ribosylation factor-like protein 3
MGLLDLLKSYKKFKKDPNLLILGLDNAGKTTLLHNLTQEKVQTTEPTKGVNIKTIIQEGFTINVWDIGGQKEIRQYWYAYYDNVDAILYVVDSSDDDRIAECNDQLQILLKEEKLKKVPLLVYANKADLKNCLGADEIVDKLELNNIVERDWSLYACSALKGFGIMDGLQWLMDKIASNLNDK